MARNSLNLGQTLLRVALLCGLSLTAAAQERPGSGGEQKSVRIMRTDTPPVIDGVLDEEAWSHAARIEDFHEIQPTEYAPPTERTVVYLMYDDNALYIGARLYDRMPHDITARILRQGEQVFGDDWFSVILDPFHDQRSGYRFQTNPNGLRQEALYKNVSELQWDWRGIWYTASKIDADGWVAEMKIPFKTLSFDPNNDTWGINFRRSIARRDERLGWVSRNRNTDPSTAGIAVGFEGLKQGLGLDLVPSMSVSRTHDFQLSGTTNDLSPSLDLFYKISPSLTGSLTFNTDFSATEIDDRQVNLTRFDLFFPEKRDFFLQDSDIFEFGGVNQNGRPFFSRSIGLTPDGQLVNLKYGGKLTGRIGRWNIGALSVRQDAFNGLPADNATVARVSANLLAESSIGLIATEGHPGSTIGNSLVGMDFTYRNSRLPGGRLIEVNAWKQKSDTEGIDGKQGAYGFRFRMPNSSGFRGGLRFTHLEDNFNPGLGFVNWVGINQLNFGTQYTYRPREGSLRSILGGVNGQRVELISGRLQSQTARYRLLELEDRRGDKLQFEHTTDQEVLDNPFEISTGITLPTGSYSFAATRLSLQTGDQRKLSGSTSIQHGGFYDGDRDEIGASIVWRPSGHLRTAFSYQYNDVHLLEGDFKTRLVSFRTDVAFSSKLSWVTRLQYDNVSNLLGINVRLHWTPEAGRDAYLVLNHTLQDFDLDNRFQSMLAEAAIKFSYTFRF